MVACGRNEHPLTAFVQNLTATKTQAEPRTDKETGEQVQCPANSKKSNE